MKNDSVYSGCKMILDKLIKNPGATAFMVPVSTSLYPSYPRLIKRPMDLGTIRKKLNAKNKRRGYENINEFAVDVRLVFHNAQLFNIPDSSIYKYAEQLGEQFEELYSSLLSSLRADLQASFSHPPAFRSQKRVGDHHSIDALTTHKRRKRSSTLDTTSTEVKHYDYTNQEFKNSDGSSMELRKNLVEELKKLQEAGEEALLNQVLDIINGMEESRQEEGGEQVVQVDLISLPDSVVDELRVLVSNWKDRQ
eukprot:TRINITY_DN2164_c0_g3_i6.p1 TRINITY_DN2164_c0_g3~~TRINITY_DN2164_c0_g3_i6.p1  ORF type:complete len:251 (+),score=38.72 TRINITY_DN2164_c0_g3_i6:741-1493(+)